MPGLARKLLIFAALDGLVIQQRGGPSTKIAYKDNSITQVSKDATHSESSGKTFEAFGLVGKLAHKPRYDLWLVANFAVE